jgi:hypothetical protein
MVDLSILMTPLISTLETPLQCTEKPARLTYASCVCPSAFRSKETWTKLPTDRSTGRSASVVQNIQTVRCSKLHARSTHINGGSYTRNDGTHTCRVRDMWGWPPPYLQRRCTGGRRTAVLVGACLSLPVSSSSETFISLQT